MTYQGVTHSITPDPFLLSSVVRPGQHVGTAVVHATPEPFARAVDAALLSHHVHGRLETVVLPILQALLPLCFRSRKLGRTGESAIFGAFGG